MNRILLIFVALPHQNKFFFDNLLNIFFGGKAGDHWPLTCCLNSSYYPWQEWDLLAYLTDLLFVYMHALVDKAWVSYHTATQRILVIKNALLCWWGLLLLMQHRMEKTAEPEWRNVWQEQCTHQFWAVYLSSLSKIQVLVRIVTYSRPEMDFFAN